MEEHKSMKDKVDELYSMLGKPGTDFKVERKGIHIPGTVWMWGFILALVTFLPLWLLWDLWFAIIISVLVLVASIFIGYIYSKSWRPPFKARMMSKKAKRKGFVVFIHVGRNKAISFIKAQLDEGVAIVNNIPHVVNSKDILLWKRKLPMVIQLESNEQPINLDVDKEYSDAKKAGLTTEGWQFIISKIRKDQIEAKKKMNMFIWIVIVLAIIAGGWYLIKGGF